MWNQKTSARASNYGSRVDFILAAGPPAAATQADTASPRLTGPESSQAGGAGACSPGADPRGPVSAGPQDDTSPEATGPWFSPEAVLHQVCCAVSLVDLQRPI